MSPFQRLVIVSVFVICLMNGFEFHVMGVGLPNYSFGGVGGIYDGKMHIIAGFDSDASDSGSYRKNNDYFRNITSLLNIGLHWEQKNISITSDVLRLFPFHVTGSQSHTQIDNLPYPIVNPHLLQ